MKYIVVTAVFIVCLSSLALAQTAGGYVFFAPGQVRALGQSSTTLHFGGGGTYIAKNGLGFGAELGIAGPKTDFGTSDFGLFSLNGYYAFKTGVKDVEPYVTGGYSRSFGHESGANLGNFGFGANFWFKERMGFMAEFRDHIHREFGVTFQMWEIRMGLAFRGTVK